MAADYRTAPLSEVDRAMLEYSVRLTRSPFGSEQGIDTLREVGFDDRAILDICQVAAYYNYVNRLADGLGVELEPYWSEEDLTMTPTEFDARVKRRRAHHSADRS